MHTVQTVLWETFPAELRRARRAAGLTVAQAAHDHGVSARTWAYWEAGRRRPLFALEIKALESGEHILASLRARVPLSSEDGILLLPD